MPPKKIGFLAALNSIIPIPRIFTRIMVFDKLMRMLGVRKIKEKLSNAITRVHGEKATISESDAQPGQDRLFVGENSALPTEHATEHAEKIDKELEAMFRAGIHFGYSRSRRHPKMAPYLFGIRNNVEIFDLEKVRAQLFRAMQFLEQLGQQRKTILFVGTKPSLRQLTEKTARAVEMPYVSTRWLGGTLTNFKIIRQRVERMSDLKRQHTESALDRYTKKERLLFNRELTMLERRFGGLETMTALPMALVIVDSGEEATAMREAARMHIPTVAIMNVDCDPSKATYAIPANDAAPSSVAYILDKFSESYKKGKLAAITQDARQTAEQHLPSKNSVNE